MLHDRTAEMHHGKSDSIEVCAQVASDGNKERLFEICSSVIEEQTEDVHTNTEGNLVDRWILDVSWFSPNDVYQFCVVNERQSTVKVGFGKSERKHRTGHKDEGVIEFPDDQSFSFVTVITECS